MPRDAFVLKVQRELCHPKYARKVSGLSRNRPQDGWKTQDCRMTKKCSATLRIPGLARHFFRYSAVLSLPAVLLRKFPNIQLDKFLVLDFW